MFNVNGDPQIGVVFTDVTASVLLQDSTVVDIGVSSSAWVPVTAGAFNQTGMYALNIHSASISQTGSFSYAVNGGPATVTYIGSIQVVDFDNSDLYTVVLSITQDSGSIASLSSSLRNEILGIKDTLSASIVTTSASLATTIETSRVNLSASIVTTSASLWNMIETTRSNLSSSLVNVSSSLRTEIISSSSSLGSVLNRLRIVSEGRWKIFDSGLDANKQVIYDPVDNTTVFMKFGLSGSDGTPTTTNPFERNPTG